MRKGPKKGKKEKEVSEREKKDHQRSVPQAVFSGKKDRGPVA